MEEVTGDLLSVEKGIILHGCNCLGGFGSGVAGAIRRKYPRVAENYESLFSGHKNRFDLLGDIQPVMINKNLIIINAFTQKKFGSGGLRYASPDAIHNSLMKAEFMTRSVQDLKKFDTFHVPRIGAGLGGLDWETDVKPVYRKFEETTNIKLKVWFLA